MASGVGKHKLLSLGPTEPWSVREKLCLASSVMKSGDQNWVSVSRAIKPFAEPGRPPDWFSQKHCASQYSELLETTETPKRKRGEKGEVVETVEDVIVRKLTAERIEELKRLIRDTQEKHRRLKKESELIQAGHLDSKLEELWGGVVQKEKQEEEEAELKRKTTDAAYQARLAVKNTPKRVPSVTVRSPLGASSPSLDFPPAERPPAAPEEPSVPAPTPGGAVFMPLPEAAAPGLGEGGLGPLLDDSPQKKLLGQKATPPPSPLLSELLKKGSLLPTSPRLVGEGDGPAGHVTGAHGTAELQLPTTALPTSQAATGAPTLSRLLEARPAHFPSPLGSLAMSPAPDNPGSLNTGDDLAENPAAGEPPPAAAGKEAELGDEDLVTVSYMGDDLDLETVGDIIAIIEEKVDDNAEALDAAAVEAALSLCEEVADSHALTGPWEAGPFKPPEPGPAAPPIVSPVAAVTDAAREAKTEPLEEKCRPLGATSLILAAAHSHLSPAPSSSAVITSLTRATSPLPEAGTQGGASRGEGPREQNSASPHVTIKFESEEWPQPGGDTPRAGEQDAGLRCTPPSPVSPSRDPAALSSPDSGAEDCCASETPSKDVKEEDVGSDADEGSGTEMKECGEGDPGEGEGCPGEGAEPYLSEAELEPAASESEDGCSLHTASSLQLHNTADSIPSSPASSQFSMCSEDQEAIQAQKIWKKAIMLVWRAAANHRYANVFLQPVTDDIAPGYHSIVHRPMDLSTIKKNIETGLIRTTAEFQRDIMLMFQNAVMYNSSDHDVYHMALEMQRDVLEQVQQFLATQLIMQTSESGISAKSLRGRDSARKQDSSDKDGGTRGRRCAIEADMKMKK
ncbi:bromodomain-containing protein 8 isoform X2 [Brienomyrus brachyistius]|uniref:bromodomain-containing protein 8 isoform X2 n=1 Tax=Brienomyrus brachyistius TaxID=42636 RepID=UPI0020B2A821|nr:bromodomain-containing protein 8 isoform X2 [Brienomyrus brachyistius]